MITTSYDLLKSGLLFIVLSILVTACNNNAAKTNSAVGTYRMYSDDPTANRFLASENNFIQVNKDNTIIYNTTINSKPKFHFTGTYTFDQSSNTLTINWTEGKLPGTLKIEKNGEVEIIKIGQTNYKKQKT